MGLNTHQQRAAWNRLVEPLQPSRAMLFCSVHAGSSQGKDRLFRAKHRAATHLLLCALLPEELKVRLVLLPDGILLGFQFSSQLGRVVLLLLTQLPDDHQLLLILLLQLLQSTPAWSQTALPRSQTALAGFPGVRPAMILTSPCSCCREVACRWRLGRWPLRVGKNSCIWHHNRPVLMV